MDNQRTIAIALANTRNMPLINSDAHWDGGTSGDSDGLHIYINTDGRGEVNYSYCYFQ